MILLLCAALFSVPFSSASLSGLNDTHIHTSDAYDCPSCNTRTMWDIISSCGLTLFACTWTAVHMNIPYVDHDNYNIQFCRLCLMVVAFIAPEVITALAAWELFKAYEFAKDFNHRALGFDVPDVAWWRKLGVMLLGCIRRLRPRNFCGIRRSSDDASKGWTVTHGFFAYMGGFVLYIDNKPQAVLTPAELLQVVCDKSVEMPNVTEADIEDRSKGDLLSKCVAILQLLWFVIQIIARYAQHLPVTLLEIDTLSVTAVACISYFLWLKKPKDIGRPYIVHWDSKAKKSPSDYDFKDKYYSTSRLGQSFRHYFLYIRFLDLTFAGAPTFIASVGGMVFGAIHCLGWNVFPRHTEQILWRVASIGMPCSLMVPLLGSVVALLLHSYFKPKDDTEYVNSIRTWFWDKVLPACERAWDKITTALGLPSEAEVPTALERAEVPTALERAEVPTALERALEKVPDLLKWIVIVLLMVIAAVVGTVLGIVLGAVVTIVTAPVLIVQIVAMGIIPLYLFARFTIIALMFLSLRSLPPGAYDTVVWSHFIPHL